MRITVYKSRRVLVLRQGGHVLMKCACRLGASPVGHKACEGDGRTPEGLYRVCSKNPKSKFHLALGISYPNAQDARRALRAGQISPEICRAMISAQKNRRRPAWDTPLGGWIMIHGEPADGRNADCDWTQGCIALKNADMERLYRAGYIGLRVAIRP